MHKRTPKTARHGILLLLILGILAMFGVVAIALVVIASQQQQGAEISARIGQQEYSPQKDLNQAAMQVFRGTNNDKSVLRPFSLLEDKYGNVSIRGTMNAREIFDGQLLEFDASSFSRPRSLVGRVLTLLDGPGTGHSSRIVRCRRVGAGPPLYMLDVMAFDKVLSSSIAGRNTKILINGAPFCGTGFGYDASASPFLGAMLINEPDLNGDGVLDLAEDTWSRNHVFDNWPYALVPNPVTFKETVLPWGDYTDPAGPGGANEDYDAADLQNMVLAMLNANGSIRIPSLHRPALIRYWFNLMATDTTLIADWPAGFTPEQKWRAILQPLGRDGKTGGTGADMDFAIDPDTSTAVNELARDIIQLKKRFILRPLREGINPEFDGGNPKSGKLLPDISSWPLAMLQDPTKWWCCNGPWDVDNNGDGEPDSIWVDLGTPVRSLPDGRKCKQLHAILCLDLDGRVNVNMHGNLAQLDSTYINNTASITGPYAGSGSAVLSGRGVGIGPADIRLDRVIDQPGEAEAVMLGNTDITGRYGKSSPSNPAKPGIRNKIDALASVKHFGYPKDDTPSDISLDILTEFGIPPDPWGDGAVALDFAGQPVFSPSPWNSTWPSRWDITSWEWGEIRKDNPYEMNLSRKAARGAGTGKERDNLFTVAELEPILRAHDIDAGMLPDRLATLANNTFFNTTTGSERRHQVTTNSVDIPSPTIACPPYLQSDLETPAPATHFTELVRAKMARENGWSHPFTPAQENQLEILLDSVPWDLLANVRMDINRPLGDGRDGDGDGAVDESGISIDTDGDNIMDTLDPDGDGSEVGWRDAFGSDIDFKLTNGIDVDGNGSVNNVDNALARQLYARHLFMLMMILTDDNYEQPSPIESLSNAQRRELTIRRMAQWAVNVVDFRDADSIMTPFEYDENPFVDNSIPPDGNPWDVDGIVGSLDDNITNNPDRRLVWGCEAPEAVLTEIMAVHDRCVADTDFDTGGGGLERDEDGNGVPGESGEDDDMDQVRLPQGPAFFEIYCPRGPRNPTAPSDLYKKLSNRWYLNLGERAPAGNDGITPSIEYPVWRMAISKSHHPASGRTSVSDRLQAQPDSTSLEPAQYSSDPNTFSLLAGSSETVDIDRIIWFASIRPTTHYDSGRIYYRQVGSNALLGCGKYAVVGPREVTSIGAQRDPANPNVFGIPAPQEIRLNSVEVTDLLGSTTGYPAINADIRQPVGIIVGADLPSAWTGTPIPYLGVSVSEPLPGSYYPEPTEPNPNNPPGWDDAYGDLTQADPSKPFRDTPLDSQAGRPLAVDGVLATGTTLDYKTVFLQRLANPTAPYHPVTNPYRTVDWSPIDLTVFNGEDNPPVGWDPDDPAPDTTPPVAFQTRQRNGANNNIWAALQTAAPSDTDPDLSAPPEIIFTHNLLNNHTLGYLNAGFGAKWTKTALDGLSPPPPSPGDYDDYIGIPRTTPFPWIAWNNRPYASPFEVLQVPSSHPGRLLYEFTVRKSTDPYDAAAANPPAGFAWPYGHLANFFHASRPNIGTDESPNLYRILEFLRVPSPFVGTETVLSPDEFHAAAADDPKLLLPPYNKISSYQEPGKININTISSPAVWNALLSGYPGAFNDLEASRRGYTSNPQDYPTAFANPFRSFTGNELVPLTDMRDLIEKGVHATLLRNENGLTGGDLTKSLFAVNNGLPYIGTDNNSHFRFQSLQRLGNLVTTRSNVYAVWITVGYFEIDQATGKLGAELGTDTGDINRHRAFYIFDRSIPVGFERGEDLNVGKAILLSRFIE